MGAAPDEEQWQEAEPAVRLLLETAVPSHAAPADWMDRIRRRVRVRRRRRRTAAAAAVAAVAALVIVVSGPGTGAPMHRKAPALSPSPTPTSVTGPASVRLLGPDRPVTVELPKGWYALSFEDARGMPLGFVSSQPLSRPASGSCVAVAHEALRGCRPFPRLAEGGVLIVLRHSDAPDATSGTTPLGTNAFRAVDSCAGVGADGQSNTPGSGTSASAGSFDVLISVCRRSPTARTAAEVQKVLYGTLPADGI